ncbi:MAG: ATP-binding protein, partial [Deltaproteobacteria bacterium]|nr:ATP-binding protein [Deltaproteobacteria bacterium]
QRESLLLPIALYLDAHNAADLNAPADAQAAALRRLLARDLGLVLLDTREVQPGLGVHSLPIDVDKPTPAEQQAAWVEALGPEAGTGPARLAGQFNLNLTTIQQVARAALPGPPGEPLTAAAWQSCLLRTRPRLDKLAQRLDPKVSWDDIVLPAEPEALLRQISAQVGQRATVYDTWGFRHKMNRGLGISALFVGESGTGKTMAAEVIANDLELNLYRIDLSAVVSKYIGETEKNLRQVFDAAEDGGVILFFDEADALFGKRSEVRDSHDRYANIEVNYLLQRMEAYRGLAILATNVRSALDPAFPRRLRFIVTFPYPGIPERRVMWDKVFPQPDAQRGHEGTPVEALDSDFLARIPLTGGSIHNTALGAAFLAAQAGTPVTMPLLLAAARTEVRKVEKPVSEAEFRLPSAVRARREAWQVRLADRASGEEMALHDIDYDRLAWHDVDDQAMAQALDRSVERARQANGALTTDLIAAELGKSRGLESGEPR